MASIIVQYYLEIIIIDQFETDKRPKNLWKKRQTLESFSDDFLKLTFMLATFHDTSGYVKVPRIRTQENEHETSEERLDDRPWRFYEACTITSNIVNLALPATFRLASSSTLGNNASKSAGTINLVAR